MVIKINLFKTDIIECEKWADLRITERTFEMQIIRLIPWQDHVVISIPVYREWDNPINERIHIWTDHHWRKGVSKI